MTKYINNKQHRRLLDHYFTNMWGGNSLAFTREWGDLNLSKNVFVHLIDSRDNVVYLVDYHVAYDEINGILDVDYHAIDGLKCLSPYVYNQHFCPCNRKLSAQRKGAFIEDDECEGDRFKIERITCEKYPDLILCSEVYSLETLEGFL